MLCSFLMFLKRKFGAWINKNSFLLHLVARIHRKDGCINISENDDTSQPIREQDQVSLTNQWQELDIETLSEGLGTEN